MDYSSLLVPTEDTVQILVDHLVNPLLPSKASLHESPSLSQQEAVAKQMHAVVLLYNYYHRKQFPQLEFLNFESFCKVAVNAKPSLLVHLKFMQGSNDELGDLDKKLSVTEKMIMDACNICRELDASKDAPSMDRWPVSKVTVFVVDSAKKNCFLKFSSLTHGVWSIIEKDLEASYCNLTGNSLTKNMKKAKTNGSKPFGGELLADEAKLQQLAFSAVKEEKGIDPTDLIILESHFAYSLSQEKTTARFYLMQCTKAVSEEVEQVPIKYAISSLQGPLVRKFLNIYEHTLVVEYFHLLPYVDILSDWLSRESSSSPQLLPKGVGNVTTNSSPKTDKTCSMVGEKISVCSPRSLPSEDETESLQNIFQAKHVEKRKNSCSESGLKVVGNGIEDEAEMVDLALKPYGIESTAEKLVRENDISNDSFLVQNGIPTGDLPLVPFLSNSPNIDKLQHFLASKGNDLLQSSLQALQRKRDVLSQQQRQLEDEIAKCDKNLETILNGGDDALMLKMETIIEVCNDACSKAANQFHSERYLPSGERHLHHNIKRKRLSEAILNLRNPCQELDDICCLNYWMLPKYSVFSSNGGFQANVTVKGLDFECSGSGDLQKDPREARESAATHMLSKLRSMASQAQ